MNNSQLGLVAGQTHYLTHNRTLTTIAINNLLVGRTVFSTKLLITNWAV